jgi:hypothetical protein
MKINHYTILWCILLPLFTACGRQSASITIGVPTPTPIPRPEPGKATITGNLFSTNSDKPLPNTAVWLAEVVRQGEQGAYVLDAVFSPGVYADENGIFVISNVIPGEYVIVVGDPESQHEIISESSGKAKVWDIPADQIYDVGELTITLTK